MRTPTSLLIAGAQKSCSTSLAALLDRHPLLCMLPRETVAFEDPYYPKGLREVNAHLESSLDADTVPAFKRPELLHQREASRRARQHLPDPVVVVVLREPVARTISAYYHYVSHGLLPPLSLDMGVSALLDRLHRKSPSSIGDAVVTYSLYSAAIGRLQEDFGQRLLVFFQEELLSDTAGCTANILSALGIEPYDLGLLPRTNVGKYSLNPRKLSRLGGLIGYDIDDTHGRFSVTQHPLRRRTAQSLFVLSRLRPSVRRTSQPLLCPSVRAQLVDTLIGDVELLPDMIRRPLPDPWISSFQH
jgi:hypothetical protein